MIVVRCRDPFDVISDSVHKDFVDKPLLLSPISPSGNDDGPEEFICTPCVCEAGVVELITDMDGTSVLSFIERNVSALSSNFCVVEEDNKNYIYHLIRGRYLDYSNTDGKFKTCDIIAELGINDSKLSDNGYFITLTDKRKLILVHFDCDKAEFKKIKLLADDVIDYSIIHIYMDEKYFTYLSILNSECEILYVGGTMSEKISLSKYPKRDYSSRVIMASSSIERVRIPTKSARSSISV